MAVAGYEYRVDGGSPVDAGNVLTTTVSGLTPDTEYDFEVRSYDGAGNRSAWSSVVSATTDAEPIYSLRINAGVAATAGNWLDQSPYISGGTPYNTGSTGFELNKPMRPGRTENNTVYGAGQIGSLATWTVTGLTPGVNARIRVHAHDFGLGAGVFVQKIKVNGVDVEAEYDVRTYGGGSSHIGIKEITAMPDGSGNIAIQLVEAVGKQVCAQAIEIRQPVPQSFKCFHFLGDSITEGGGIVTSSNRYLALLTAPYAPHNVTDTSNTFTFAYDEEAYTMFHVPAQSGNGLVQQGIYITDPGYYDNYVDPLYAKQGALILCGVNDLMLGHSLATMRTDMQTIVTDLAGRGITWIAMGTVLPSTSVSGGNETTRLAFNADIMANYWGVDMVVDTANDARLSNPNDTTYYQVDALHPNVAGQAAIADVFEDVLPTWWTS